MELTHGGSGGWELPLIFPRIIFGWNIFRVFFG